MEVRHHKPYAMDDYYLPYLAKIPVNRRFVPISIMHCSFLLVFVGFDQFHLLQVLLLIFF